MTGELRALTSLRGIAAWLVVLYHIRLSIAGLPSALRDIFAKGYLAVDFFFLLSGFVIWLAWHERLRGADRHTLAHFWRKRIARIWPLHVFLLACIVALELALQAIGRGGSSRYYSFEELPLQLLLIQNWGFTDAIAWNYPAWSISCELAAYLLFPLLVTAVDWRRVPSWAIIFAITAALILLWWSFGATANLGADLTRLGLRRCLFEFGAGTAIGALWLRWHERPALPALGAAMLAVLLGAGWAWGLPETLVVPAFFVASLLGFALTSNRRGNPLDTATLHYLGEISFATYLGHFPLWLVFKLVLVEDATAVPPALIALYLLLVLGSSAVLYRLVELPAQRWINALPLRAPARFRPPRAPAGPPARS